MNNSPSNTLKKPAVGVLSRNTTIKKLLKQQPVANLPILEMANHTAGTILYYFSIKDVDLRKRKINGVYFNNQKDVWEKQEFPYPDFIYQRCTDTRRNKDLFKSFEEDMKELKIETLNYPKNFNKWEVYKHLSEDKAILPYLPLTSPYNSPGDLKNMLKYTDKVYLKGLEGGRGRKVICAAKLPDGGYEYKYFIDRLYVCKVNNFNNLVQGLLAFYKGKKFLMQEAIDLIQIGDRLVDMRAEVQRGKNGELMVVAIPVRVGNNNAPITAHADAYPFEHFFKNIMNCCEVEVKDLENKAAQFLKSVYRSLENVYGPSVEMGIDFGLDKNGRIWFIECNSRSMKVSLHKAYDENTIKRTGLNILEYAQFRYSKNY